MFVYEIRNIVNDKRYVGQSSQKDQQRLWEHKTYLKKGTHQNRHLQRAWNKYGEENFLISILDECSSLDELNRLETHYVNLHKTLDRTFGYNIRGPGDNKFMLKETRHRISQAKLGVSVHTPESIEKIRQSSKNRIHSQESREKRSQKLKGYKWSQEICDARSKNFRKEPYPILVSPDGHRYDVVNLTRFAKEHGLVQQSLSNLVNKHLTQYKGWTILPRGSHE
jgi:group I intron endonuclease